VAIPRLVAFVAILVGGLTAVVPAAAQIPDTFENLQVLPKDIPREALVQRMREFSFALGVRCQYCHAGGDGISFEGVMFSSDARPTKLKARAMLRMVATLNDDLLAHLPSRRDPPVAVDCVICHRGLPVPKTLATELRDVIRTDGVAAAVSHYRELREKTMLLGRFSFDQWTMNELARQLGDEGQDEAAIAMLTLNAEYYPKSADIDYMLGELHRKTGDRERAIASYRAALDKRPDFARARQRLDELLKQGGGAEAVGGPERRRDQ